MNPKKTRISNKNSRSKEKITPNLSERISDQQLTEWLSSGVRDQENEALKYIIKTYRAKTLHLIKSFVSNTAEAEDAFSIGVVNVFKGVKEGRFKGGSFAAYLINSCRNAAQNIKRASDSREKREHIKSEEYAAFKNLTAEDLIMIKERKLFIESVLQKLGEVCKNVLWMRANGFKSKEIAINVGYSSAEGVDKKHSVCKKKLVQLIRQNPKLFKLLKQYFDSI